MVGQSSNQGGLGLLRGRRLVEGLVKKALRRQASRGPLEDPSIFMEAFEVFEVRKSFSATSVKGCRVLVSSHSPGSQVVAARIRCKMSSGAACPWTSKQMPCYVVDFDRLLLRVYGV